MNRSLLAITALLLLATTKLFAQEPNIPSIRIAILGNPVNELLGFHGPQVAWTDEALERLKAIGFNEVVVDLPPDSSQPGHPRLPGTAERRAELKRRITLAKQHGLRLLFILGSPYMDRNPYTGDVPGIPYHFDDVTFDSWYDILNPNVRDYELASLREFRWQFPEVDDILVYTYDVGAWQTPEFQWSRFSYGIPLSDRLPGYLAALHKAWTEGRTGKARMWWEPWELSAGQVYAILPKLPRTDFGLMIHSNIAETQLALPVDVWFRNVARMCRERGIPVVAQGFFQSATEELDPLSIPAPRLVDEQYLAFMRVPGVVGIAEYMYGVNPTVPDLNVDLLQARLRDPSCPTDELIADITKRFGTAQADVRAYLGLLSDALQTYPWDASWRARDVGRASTDHGWSGAAILGLVAPTPSWKSTRHAKFMKTDNAQPHFWMLEDVELRCKLAADLLDKASDLAAHLLDELPNSSDRAQFQQIQNDVDIFRRVSRSYALHLRETNVAQMLRQDLAEGRPMTAALVKELGQLLDSDVANQKEHGRVVEMRRLYCENPEAFVRRYLIPVDVTPIEKGFYTLTTR